LLVETNPTGHVQADGFFSRFLLVQQKVQKRMAKRKIVTMSEEVPDVAAAAAAATAASPHPAAKPSASAHLLSSTYGAHAHAEAPERSVQAVAGGSPSSPSAKLTQMHHRKEPSWSSLTQPGSNQVLVTRQLAAPCNRRMRIAAAEGHVTLRFARG
jgi:hypothetical protein